MKTISKKKTRRWVSSFVQSNDLHGHVVSRATNRNSRAVTGSKISLGFMRKVDCGPGPRPLKIAGKASGPGAFATPSPSLRSASQQLHIRYPTIRVLRDLSSGYMTCFDATCKCLHKYMHFYAVNYLLTYPLTCKHTCLLTHKRFWAIWQESNAKISFLLGRQLQATTNQICIFTTVIFYF